MKKTTSILLLLCLGLTTHAAEDNLNLVFTTTDAGGDYGREHVHVVYLTTRNGVFVSTVGNDAVRKRALWANRRAYALTYWWKSNPKRQADVIARTGATPYTYKTYNLNWNWQKQDGSFVPDGDYKLHFECTNDDSGDPRNYLVLDITKGRTPWTLGPLTQNGYTKVTLTHTIVSLSVRHHAPTAVTEVSATLHGNLRGTENTPHTLQLYWGPQDGGTEPANWDYRVTVPNLLDENYSVSLSGLTPHQTYYYRAQVQGPTETLWASSTDHFYTDANSIIFREGSWWQYFEGYSFPGENWTQVDFQASARQGWKTGPSGFGYADGDDATELKFMRNRYVTVYLRHAFTLHDMTDITQMDFLVDYDDGFVAYLNGTEVARRGVPEGQTKDTLAKNHPAVVDGGQIETISLNAFISTLQSGKNIFAIEVHNTGINSPDLTMIPELRIEGLRSAQPNIELSTTKIDFGTTTLSQPVTKTLTLSNTGQLDLNIQSLKLVGLHPKAFSITAPPHPLTIAPGEKADVTIAFHPTEAKTYIYTQCMVGSNDWDQPLAKIPLTGQGE